MKNYETFEDYWAVIHNDCREQCMVDKTLKNVRKWMERSFYSARVENRYIVTIEEADNGELVLPIPLDSLKAKGWDENTKLKWVQLASGSWEVVEV